MSRYFTEKIETASREELHKIQSERLKKAVKRCYENVPFYQKLFDEKGIKPEDIISSPVSSGENTAASVIRQEASEALVALGYSVSDAYRVIQQVEISEDTTVEAVIKAALRNM